MKACVGNLTLSRSVNDKTYYKIQTERTLPLRFLAPETIKHLAFTSESDVFSFGVFLYQLYGDDRTPYAYLNDGAYLGGLSAGTLPGVKMPPSCPSEVQALIVRPVEHKAYKIKIRMARHLDSTCVLAPAHWLLGPKHVSNPAYRGVNPI